MGFKVRPTATIEIAIISISRQIWDLKFYRTVKHEIEIKVLAAKYGI